MHGGVIIMCINFFQYTVILMLSRMLYKHVVDNKEPKKIQGKHHHNHYKKYHHYHQPNYHKDQHQHYPYHMGGKHVFVVSRVGKIQTLTETRVCRD